MHMPLPYNSESPLASVNAKIYGRDITAHLLRGSEQEPPSSQLETILTLNLLKPHDGQDKLVTAREKVAENHYQEHVKTRPQAVVSKSTFKASLTPESITVWLDGSWAMSFCPAPEVMGCKQIVASFPVDRPSFTSVIG